MAKRKLIERYILRAIFPYTLVSLVLLTTILFAQQTGRYFETSFHGLVPSTLVNALALALLPTVLVFTIPMAVLAGTIIGLGRMASDSELVAIRAAGVSTWRMLWPTLALGLIATAATFELNLKEAPRAQQQLKSVVVRSALYKLDSPVEPRTFTSDIPGYVIYVRDGDKSRGEWGRVFIQSQEADQSTLLRTARVGRIDSSADTSELVLQDAMETRIPLAEARDQSYVVERISQLRIVINTGRSSLLAGMQKSGSDPDQMEWSELRQTIAQTTGPKNREASMIFHKRLAFSFAPIVFALFGAALALRMRRGSRGFGALISLFIMLIYYLVTLGGDQMARAGSLPPVVGAWLATALAMAMGIVLLAAGRRKIGFWFKRTRHETAGTAEDFRSAPARRAIRAGARRWVTRFPTLLDWGIVRTMGLSFLFGFVALVLIFNVFTTFELWRFIAANRASVKLVGQYLFYLLPLVSVELFPGSVLVAALMTYALVARRREAVAWWASGQSVYRLMLPGLCFAILISFGSWYVQERVMPEANVRQDNLRAQIRGGSVAQVANESERRWLVSADGSRIYAYEYDERRQVLLKPAIYEFDKDLVELKRVTFGEEGKWLAGNEFEIDRAHWINLDEARVTQQSAAQIRISGVDPPSVFKPTVDRPSQLSADRLRSYIKTLKARGADTAALAVALQRKYASPFSVIVMALIGMPLAISLGRKSTVVALCSAVVVSLAFWLVSGGFQQLGEHALLPPGPAVWTPIVIFVCGGLYFISRVRT
jgi:LPS export ABC transporter permease LptF/LPS export ABC transporter permease LptG